MKIKYILLAFLVLSLGSCKKFLDVKPKNDVEDNQTIFDKASAETAINGTYRALAAEMYYGKTFQFAIYLQGGDLGWGDARTVNRQFIQRDVRADNEEVKNVWRAIYKTINQANHVIEKVPNVNDATLTSALKNSITGEAYFIRALAYFDLARTWGGVQIVLSPTEKLADKAGIKRSTVDEVYAQVLSDLTKAEPLLPATVNRVRATQKTVKALRARYHLYRKEYAQAETYASALIDDAANYPLVKPYNSWFAANAIGSRESILETSYSANNPNTHRNDWQPTTNGGIRSWYPTDAFVALVNDTAIGGNRKTMIAKTPAGLWYGNIYYRPQPAIDPSYILRIAEQYLIRAEARAFNNNLPGAIADLNLIRNRAGLPPTTAVTQEQILLAIENERRFEFAFEPHRWFDLVRTGRIGTVLGLTDANKYVLPLPIAELNVDANLTQNPGY